MSARKFLSKSKPKKPVEEVKLDHEVVLKSLDSSLSEIEESKTYQIPN
jgi:hypothetical protein